MSSAPTESTGRTTLLVAQLLTALLLLLIGIWLVVLFFLGVNGGVLLVIFAAVEIVVGLLSLAVLVGLRAGTRTPWVPRLAVVGAAFNAAVIAFAAIATVSVSYPGGPVVLLILCNDVIIGELAVLYLLSRPAT